MNEKETEALRQKYRAHLTENYGREFADKWYRKQLEESLAGYQSQLDKEIASETERITNEIIEEAKTEAFAIIKETYGIEIVEDLDGKIWFDEEILNFLIPLLRDLSPIFAHPETKHVSIELTRGAGEIWNIKIVNRAE